MPDWIDPKEFKRLWSSLVKDGWRARRPSGLSSDHTYVKPGVKGKLQKDKVNVEYFVGTHALWTYAIKEGLFPPATPQPRRSSFQAPKPPIGKLAAYAAVRRRHPEPPATEEVVGVGSATVPATEQVNHASGATVPATEQVVGVCSATLAATEQAADVSGPAASRQQVVIDVVENFEEERKTEDEPAFDAFDRDDFMEAFRAENLFGPVDVDDVNLSDEPFLCSAESEDEGSAFDEQEGGEEDYVDDVESDPDFEDVSEVFRQDDAEMRELASSGWELYDEDHCAELKLDGAALYNGRWGTTKSAAAFAESPIGMFFYFLPKSLWKKIALESDAYRQRSIPAIAQQTRERQLAVQAKDPKKSVEDLENIIDKLERQKPIREHEILHVIGLLVSRTLCGHTDGLAKHWSVNEEGAVPRGTFGRYMKRERFRTITRFLHFTSTTFGDRTTDKAFQIRPILQVIEKTFRRGYRLGARVSFDEGTIPNRSQYNPMRTYNKEKPHKYGTKCYMTCCAVSGYCARVEVYLGAEPDKKKSEGASQRAVIRNITKAFDGLPKQRLIIADNFYSSPALALSLLPLGFYYVGTQRSDRLGWPKQLMFKQKRRPQYMPRGTYRIAQARKYPQLVAAAWMDSSPVHMIATGCSTVQTHVSRKDKRTGAVTQVPCPQLVAEYHSGMGGVDTHDQIRLQRYSIQRCIAFKKYYRQLFLAFVDMAVVNGFILHRLAMKRKGERVPTHAEYMRRLHVELLAVTAVSFRTNQYGEDLANTPLQTREHVLRSTKELYEAKSGRRKGDKKSRQFLCKVCSVLSPPKVKSFESRFYCRECSSSMGGYVPLCNTVRRTETGNTLTCSQVWHGTWGSGAAIPSHLRKKIRFRKRKRGEDNNSNTNDGDADDSG